MIRNLKDVNPADFRRACEDLERQVNNVLFRQGVNNFISSLEIDLRYRGQATNLPVSFSLQEVLDHGFAILENR